MSRRDESLIARSIDQAPALTQGIDLGATHGQGRSWNQTGHLRKVLIGASPHRHILASRTDLSRSLLSTGDQRRHNNNATGQEARQASGSNRTVQDNRARFNQKHAHACCGRQARQTPLKVGRRIDQPASDNCRSGSSWR